MGKYVWYFILLGVLGRNIYIIVPNIQRSLIKLERIDRRVLEIDSRVSGLEEKIAKYDEKITKLTLPFYREKIGREKLQMVKDGEKIYKITN